MMKYFLIIITLLLSNNLAYTQDKNSANQVLEKTYEKLEKINSLSYDLTRELNYPSNNYNAISKWECYYFFDLHDNPIGSKFQITNSSSIDVFNGTEYFSLIKEDKTSEIQNNIKKEDFGSKSYFYNSILTLRNILPIIIADNSSDKSVIDTLISGKTYKKVKINIGKRRIQNLGEDFDKMETDYNFIYTLLIDTKTYFPKEIIQSNDKNSDFIKTSFENLNIKPIAPNENSWFYSTYRKEYKKAEKLSQITKLSLGSEAPNWKLNQLNAKKTYSLDELKGKVVVLDFWIKNCGYCISSIPFLNKLYDKFKDNDFILLGINAYDTDEKINEFYKKYGLKYPVLMNGNLVAKDYGVYAFPTIFVIDKSGKIIYLDNENSDRNQLEKIIQEALK